MERRLFYKGKEISSLKAHELDPKEKVYLTGRKASLEQKEKKEKKEVKE